MIHIGDYYFKDITAAQTSTQPSSSPTHELRQDFTAGLRRLVILRPIGGHVSLNLYTEDLWVAYNDRRNWPILKAGLSMLIPTLGELQMARWTVSITLTGADDQKHWRLNRWLKNLEYMGNYSVSNLLAIIRSFVEVCPRATTPALVLTNLGRGEPRAVKSRMGSYTSLSTAFRIRALG
jgi:hypothetical protein